MNKTVEKRLVRSEVPVESTWNVDDLFVSDQAWETALNSIEEDIAKFASYKGTLHSGPKALLECLTAQEQLMMKLVKARTYASLKQSDRKSTRLNSSHH